VLEPIDYQSAVRDIKARRRRKKVHLAIQRVKSVRPLSLSQIALIGVLCVFVGWAVPVLHVLSLVGLVVLILGFMAGVIRVRADAAPSARTSPRPPSKRGRGDPPMPRPLA